ncbi:hypothetical protein [Archangium lipolyticum]|uniref:hypothetical protein n=1 Tax=Archangium lipolyticum TaxID=2970465 RepID=UPI002149DE80|nr:hypothetical protein [Archangium lipolyticum]
MPKTPFRPLLALTALSCLSACDAAFIAPAEVTLSEQFLADWSQGFPVEVGIRYESKEIELPGEHDGYQLGYLCEPSSAPVKFQTALDTLGCAPEDLEVKVWIAPAPALAQSVCAGQGSQVGRVVPGNVPPPGTTPEQGVVKTVKVKVTDCSRAETATLDF